MRKGDDIRERAFRFACDVVELTDSLWERGRSGRTLGNQLLRAGCSVGANLEEADAAQSKADFISKCTIALKEARESHYWLRILRATRKLSDDRLLGECNEIVAILTTIVRKASTK
jgi:four helix bundle protein